MLIAEPVQPRGWPPWGRPCVFLLAISEFAHNELFRGSVRPILTKSACRTYDLASHALASQRCGGAARSLKEMIFTLNMHH